MTVLREAFGLPAIFLTVALLGGLRMGAGGVRLQPPELVALVLAMLLIGALVRSRALALVRLMHSDRTALENLSGLVVLFALFAATAQVFNLVTPDMGLLHVLFSTFFLVQVLTLGAAGTGRVGFLRSVLVLLGSAFVLRFVVLETLYAPGSGALKRVLTALMQGVTLGTLDYTPNAPATGYVAFLTLLLYMMGLVLLPSADPDETSSPARPALRGPVTTEIALVLLLVAASGACGGRQEDVGPGTVGEAKASVGTKMTPGSAENQREAERRNRALEAARVWQQPLVPVSQADLANNPPGPGGFSHADDVSCRFVLDPVGGTTSKFYCQTPGGEILKVKYGGANPELYAEVATTRLLAALGFAADRMYVVRKVRCFGCPPFPFQALRCLERIRIRSACLAGGINYDKATDFDPAVVERRMEGIRIEAIPNQGWGWYELDRIDPAKGGSSRAEVDALRLLAVLLAHWDNKPENQRLICPPGAQVADGSCTAPVAVVQDVGATFGPKKLDLHNWRDTPIWADARACRVSMKAMPFAGATFTDRQISEEGRRMLLGMLEHLSDQQLTDLFTHSRVIQHDSLSAEARGAGAWVRAFQDKVRQIREGGPCPPASAITTPDG
ncbi:MAG: hypothetical protein LC753_15175 [Acidobacteria bacterium]|nr:hypothetical protein [Acidobacteriota bacterium]MCA1651550.1 hypothetical protein [Acidobacteriota bacterium]